MNKTETLEKLFKEAGLSTNSQVTDRFAGYEELLSETNKSLNLTAITEYEDIVIKHFIDSLAPFMKIVSRETFSKDANGNVSRETLNADDAKPLIKEGCKLVDVGTGAGFPGLPLKIYAPEIKLTLIDSLDKRLRFLNTVISEIKIDDAETIHARAEEGGRNKNLRDSFDVCTARAVANLSVLSEYCLPYVKPGGIFIAYKAKDSDEEILSALNAINKLGGKLEEIREIRLPGEEILRRLIVICKEKPTPSAYPRKPGTPAKDPIK